MGRTGTTSLAAALDRLGAVRACRCSVLCITVKQVDDQNGHIRLHAKAVNDGDKRD